MSDSDPNSKLPQELSERMAKKLVDMIADVEREEAAGLDRPTQAGDPKDDGRSG